MRSWLSTPTLRSVTARNETLRALVTRLARSSTAGALVVEVDPHDLERLTVPDTRPCREAERVCRAACGRSLAAHCFRSYAWAALLDDGLEWDEEMLYTAAMLHDLGLTSDYDRGGCFESDGADAAREILIAVGWNPPRLDIVAEAVYLHMHEVTSKHSAEARLLAAGATADATGRRILEVPESTRAFVLAMFPRSGFKHELIARFSEQARRKPSCVLHEYMRNGLADRIAAAPFDE